MISTIPIFIILTLHSLTPALQASQPTSDTARLLSHQANRLAYRGDVDSIKSLLRDHREDIMAAIAGEEKTPIHAALQGRHNSLSHQSVHLQGHHEEVLSLLLESGVVSADHGCPLYYALHYRNMRALDILLTHAHIDRSLVCVTALDTTGKTALHTAVKSKASGFARFFAKLRNKNPDPRVFDLLGLHPLQVSDSLTAGELNSITTHRDIEMILTHWPSLNLSSVVDCSGNTLLHEAAYSGQTLLVDFLAKKLDVNARNNFGLTPLYLAYAGHHQDIVNVLLSHGAHHVVTGCSDDLEMEEEFCLNSESDLNCSAITNNEASIDDAWWNKYVKSGWLLHSDNISQNTFTGCQIITIDIKSEDDFISMFHSYRPAVLKGLMNEWPAWERWTKDSLISKYGDLEFTVSGIPYASLYDEAQTMKITLRDFISTFNDTSAYPDYIFDGQILHRNTQLSQDAPLPFPSMNVSLKQFTVGPKGSGSPPHFHRHVLNTLVYGVKQWFLWPPSRAQFKFQHVQDWYADYSSGRAVDGSEQERVGGGGAGGDGGEQERVGAGGDGGGQERVGGGSGGGDGSGQERVGGGSAGSDGGVMECVQGPGDVLYVPENWGHAVVNLMDSVAVAYEFDWC